MRKLASVLALVLASASPVAAQITTPNTLAAGQVIRAAELNTNFSTLGDKALNRILGGSIEGNITVSTNITFDGVDISDFLLPTGEVRASTAGTASAPSFARSGDTLTGMFFPTTSELAFSLGGTSRMALTASGLTVFGVNIIDSAGKIPALSSTYFASLDGSALTALNASNISSGSLADGRLSANVPLKDATTNAFTGAATFGTTLGVTGTTTLGDLSAEDLDVDTFRLGTSTTSGFILTADASGNGTWQSAGVATGAVPSGMIAIFDAACPSTWTRVSALDNKFVRGGATYSASAGGSDTHSHTFTWEGTSGASGGHSHTVDPTSVTSSSHAGHTHTTDSQGTHTHSGGTGTTDANGGHSHTGTTDNGGTHTHTYATATILGHGDGGLDSPAGQSGVTNSSGDHNHSFSTSSVSNHTHGFSVSDTGSGGAHTHTAASGGSHDHTVDVASTASSTQTDHTHSINIAGIGSSSGSNVPAYAQVLFCKKD